jgi:acyl phosphate:glycerol-3-phosphate acyltransferase
MIGGLIGLAAAYLLGSIPSAYYAVKWLKGIDLRTVGSGNLGYTNAGRVLGYGWAAPVLLFDILKGAAAVLIARWMLPGQEYMAILAGMAAILGHTWTVFLGFKGGGKGVAVSAGVFSALSPIPFVVAFILFLGTLAATRYMSIGSIVGAASLVAAGGTLLAMRSPYAPSWEVFLFSSIVALLIIVRHHSNICRLLRGEEPTLSAKKKES